LAAAANYGGPQREKLRYAVSDAEAFIQVLKDMGGANKDDIFLLIEPDKKELIKALENIDIKIKQAGKEHRKTEIIFYYSGHSDEDGLMLGEEKLPYNIIKNSITQLSADVKVAILDSCSSGALIREKGGQMKSSFLLDSSYNMKGYAFITSSSEDEVSQESDKIKSSFFTHYLLSGLRGAADMTGDGRISLNEAYQFAYNETLGRTQKTMGGAQHAGYYIKMSGTGDVVITEIKRSEARLEIEKGLQGIFTVRSNESGLIAELQKKPEQRIQIGVDAGEYHIINQQGSNISEASLRIEKGSSVTLTSQIFTKSKREYTFSRGDKLSGYHVLPFNTQLFPVFLEYYETALCKATISLAGSYCGKLKGASISAGIDIVETETKGLQFGALGNLSKGKVTGLQISSIFNMAGADFKGAQTTGIININKGNLKGLQTSGIININKEDLKGLQITGIFNINKENLKGLQISGIGNVSKRDAVGLQAAGIFNINGSDFKGLQGAGIFNINGNNYKGLQGSGIFNINGNDYKGMQASGIFNINNGDIKGFQASGIFNINKGEIKGLQAAGIFNYANQNNGLQLGIINYSKKAKGIALGLINITPKDGMDILFWADNQSVVNLGFKFNYNNLYSIIYQGLIYNLDDSTGVGSGYLFGWQIPIRQISISADFGFFANFAKTNIIALPAAFIYNRNEYISGYKTQARLSASVKIVWNLSVYAGAGLHGKVKPTFSEMFSSLSYSSLSKVSRKDFHSIVFAGTGYNFNW